jgi:heme exporter protein D
MNWLEFFAMKGYAWYVWGSYGVAVFFLMAEIFFVRLRRKHALELLRQIHDAENLENI